MHLLVCMLIVGDLFLSNGDIPFIIYIICFLVFSKKKVVHKTIISSESSDDKK